MGMTKLQTQSRLKNEYNALLKLPLSPLMRWKLAPGQSPPFVREYHVTYTNAYLIKKDGVVKVCREPITLRFELDKDYPASAPKVKVIQGELPFHANFFVSGTMCTGTIHKPMMWLADMFIDVGKVLAGGTQTNPASPANREAAEYYVKHRSNFPIGRVDFPRLKG